MQGERGHSCPSEVRIRAEAGLAVMVTVSSIPRVTVLQAARDRTAPAAHPSTLVCMDRPSCREALDLPPSSADSPHGQVCQCTCLEMNLARLAALLIFVLAARQGCVDQLFLE